MTKEEARAKAHQWMRDNNNALAFRSCWNCNSGHEHLRSAEYVIWCFECGRYFFGGVDVTIDENLNESDRALLELSQEEMNLGFMQEALAFSILAGGTSQRPEFLKLAREVTAGKNTPVEKILAIVDELDRRFVYMPSSHNETIGPVPFERGATVDIDDACLFAMTLATSVGVRCRPVMARYGQRWTCFVGYALDVGSHPIVWQIFDPLGQHDIDKSDENVFGPVVELPHG